MKLNKTIGRVATTLVATAMLASLAAPAYAANYEAVPGGTTTFEKYLVMDKDANVPTAEFTFTVSAGTAVDATDTTPEVKAPTDEQVQAVDAEDTASFTPNSGTFDSVQGDDSVTLGNNQKYAVDTVTLDFSNVEFKAPGIYRFVVSEEASNVDGVTNDTNSDRYVDVYVVDTNGTLSVSNYILHSTASAVPANGTYTDKSTGFTNTYATQNVTLTKKVEGNMGDKSKDFTFTVTVTSAGGAKSYAINGAESGTITTSKNQDGIFTGSTTVNLCHGESITINGLSANDTYTISETSVGGYDTKIATGDTTSSDDAEIESNVISDKKTSDATAVTFYNISEASTPTGIVMDIAPYALLVVIAAAGCFVFLRKRRED